MQLFAYIADAFREFCLDEHVNVLRLRIKLQSAGFQISQNAGQTVNDCVRVRLCQNTALGKHGGVRHGTGDILFEHPPVNGNGRVKCVGQRRGFRFRPACPKFVHSMFSLSDVCKASPCHALHGKGRCHLQKQMTEGMRCIVQSALKYTV